MLEILIDNTFVMFGGLILLTDCRYSFCAPLLVDLFIYSYEADCIQGLHKNKEMKLDQYFNFKFCYT